MKKITKLFISFFLGIFLLLSNPLTAQDWIFGLKAGPNVSGIRISPGEEDDAKLGFHGGAFGMVEIADAIFLQPEVLISFQGDEVDNLTYLNFPVTVKYFFNDQFSAHTGLQIGILLFGERDVEEFLKTLDLGVPFGLEYQINDTFGVGGRYILGVTDILDPDVNNRADLFNRVFQLFVTYRLN